MKPRIIGLYSSTPGAGKTTIAKYLLTEDYHVVAFAEPIRSMIVSLLFSLGYDRVRAHSLVRYEKQTLIPELGVTIRHLLRTLGTEWGRDHIHPDIWINAWQATTDALLLQGHNIVCDDLRFPNEAALIRAYPQAEIWRIHRDTGATSEHRSDGALDDWDGFTTVIPNNGSLLDLHNHIDTLLAVHVR